jgi:NADH:ubiquinone oxidoreductase subunit 6 (subunit J)
MKSLLILTYIGAILGLIVGAAMTGDQQFAVAAGAITVLAGIILFVLLACLGEPERPKRRQLDHAAMRERERLARYALRDRSGR